MRIWLVTSSYPRRPSESSNAGVLAREVAIDLRNTGHDVVVVTPNKPGGIMMDDGLGSIVIPWPMPSIELADINPRSPRDALRGAALMASGHRLLRRHATREPPDALIALWALPSGVFARHVSNRFGIPYAVWLLGSDVWRTSQLPFARRTLTRVLEDSAASFADGVALAEAAEAVTGVSSEFLPSVRRLPSAKCHSTTPYDLLFVGRYHPNKGPDVLVNALALLREQGFTLKTGFFGSGDLTADLIQQVGNLGLEATVNISGPISAERLASALSAARALVIPSRQESIPMILGDAIQVRTPVVVTDVGDLGDIVRRFNLGEIVEPDRPDLLAEGILHVLDTSVDFARWDAAQDLFSPTRAASRLTAVLAPRPAG